MDRIILNHLDPQSIIHDSDRRLIYVAEHLPGFSRLLNRTVNKYVTIQTDVQFVGNGYLITEQSFPELYKRFVEDCRILGKNDIPRLTLLYRYIISSMSVGFDGSDMIVLSTGAVDLLTDKELDFIFGHELGHIMTGHKPYHTFVEAACDPMFSYNTIGLHVVRLALLEWYRASHFTADRMGLLCCQDIKAALSAMIKMSGLPVKYYDRIDIDGFLEQANEYQDLHTGLLDRTVQVLSARMANAPWMVKRAKLLFDWYNSDGYRTILLRQ